MSRFEREERYVVVKLKRLSGDEHKDLSRYLVEKNIPTQECVVVEPDWPNYEHVWDTVEQVANGTFDVSGEWISSKDRMPNVDDADWCGNVIWWENIYNDLRPEGWKPIVANFDPSSWEGAYIEDISEVIRNHPYWMPTGLKRPNPPKGF